MTSQASSTAVSGSIYAPARVAPQSCNPMAPTPHEACPTASSAQACLGVQPQGLSSFTFQGNRTPFGRHPHRVDGCMKSARLPRHLDNIHPTSFSFASCYYTTSRREHYRLAHCLQMLGSIDGSYWDSTALGSERLARRGRRRGSATLATVNGLEGLKSQY